MLTTIMKNKLLRKSLPKFGEWLKNYFDTKGNDVFEKPMIEYFIKKGKLSNNTWRLSNGVIHILRNRKIVTIKCTLEIEIIEHQTNKR